MPGLSVPLRQEQVCFFFFLLFLVVACLQEKLILSVCSFGVACLDIGSGVMECLCKRGYIGANCER